MAEDRRQAFELHDIGRVIHMRVVRFPVFSLVFGFRLSMNRIRCAIPLANVLCERSVVNLAFLPLLN